MDDETFGTRKGRGYERPGRFSSTLDGWMHVSGRGYGLGLDWLGFTSLGFIIIFIEGAGS